jgi:predicted Fe-Mo cluster-binding NifX family protein
VKLAEAKDECARWFAYLDRQREKSLAVQKIASQVRSGEITSDEGRRKLRTLDGAGVTVYDGARLEQAVKLLLRNLKA